MAKIAIRNHGGVPLLTLKASSSCAPRQIPDGDTIAFAATKAYKSGPVETNVPANTTGDKMVNIRLRSIDAPEKAQPFGAFSRDRLLEHLGFDLDSLGLSDEDFTADGPNTKVAGWLVALWRLFEPLSQTRVAAP